MFQAIRRFFASAPAIAGQRKHSPARKLMEAAQTRAAHDANEARDMRRAAVAQLSVTR